MLSGGEILVAEDSKLLLQLLHDALKAHGLGTEVVACRDGSQLLQHLEERLRQAQPASLYLLDIVMPGLSGIEVAHRVRDLEREHDAKQAPILFYSNRVPDDEIETAVSECWPARFVQKESGARADQLALTVIRILGELRGGARPPDQGGNDERG